MPQYRRYPNESKEDFKERMDKRLANDKMWKGMEHFVREMKRRKAGKSDPFVNLDKTQVANLQNFLQHFGYYEGKIDSIAGPKTKEAFNKYSNQTDIPVQSERMRGAGWGGKLGDKIMNYLKDLRN